MSVFVSRRTHISASLYYTQNRVHLLIVVISFLIGVLSAVLLIKFDLFSVLAFRQYVFVVESFAADLFCFCFFPFILFIFSGSIWGAVLTPLLTALFSALLTFSAISVSQLDFSVLFFFSVNAALLSCCFFVLALDCASLSSCLSAIWFGRQSNVSAGALYRHAAVSFLILCGAALVNFYVILPHVQRFLV